MNSRPGRLTGGGIRRIPPDRVEGILRHIKEAGSGKSRRIISARYRITGFRDPDTGDWISRNPRNGQFYRVDRGRHRTKVRPTPATMRRVGMVAVEVEIERKEGAPRIYYTSINLHERF